MTIGSLKAMSSPKTAAVHVTVHFPDSLLEYDKQLRSKLPGTMRRIAMEGKSFWKSEAGRKLKSSRTAYQNAIDMQVVDELSFYLSLEGFVAYSVDQGNKAFDMKPGLLQNATKISPKVGRYRVVPLNLSRYVTMTKPKVFATVHEQSKGWMHPGWKGMKISEAVVAELDTVIIPKHISKLLGEIK